MIGSIIVLACFIVISGCVVYKFFNKPVKNYYKIDVSGQPEITEKIPVDNNGMYPDVKLWDDNLNPSPFILVVDDDMSDDRVNDACVRAIEFWNSETGFTLWSSIHDIGRGEIVPLMPVRTMIESPPSRKPLGHTRLTTRGGRIISAAIYLDESRLDQLSDLQLWRVIAHEMGHVVGLRHDTIRESIMFPMAINETPILTGYDTELLIEEYDEEQNHNRTAKSRSKKHLIH